MVSPFDTGVYSDFDIKGWHSDFLLINGLGVSSLFIAVLQKDFKMESEGLQRYKRILQSL